VAWTGFVCVRIVISGGLGQDSEQWRFGPG
jgi:hypothetical protein